MPSAVFTIVAALENADAVKQTRRVLGDVAADLAGNPHLPLSPEEFPEVHFASLVVFEDGGGATLIFENCIDGPLKAYLHRLAERPGIDAIFGQCEGYPDRADGKARYEFLERRVRRPQLYHLGAPYRSAVRIREDREVRGRLDAAGMLSTPALLARQLLRPAPGIRHYRRWDLIKPWMALSLALALAWLVAAIVGAIDWQTRPWWSALALTDAVIASGGLVASGLLWRNALPELRARARPSALLALLLGPGLAAVWLIRPDLLHALRTEYRLQATVAVAALVLVWATSIAAAIRRRRRDAIAADRIACGSDSAVPLWRRLQAINDTYRRERPALVRRLWNWKWWAAVIATALALVPLVERFVVAWLGRPIAGVEADDAPVVVAALLILLFTLEALWFAALNGWPSRRASAVQRRRIVAFVLLVTVAGGLLVGLLVGGGLSPWVIGPLVALALLVPLSAAVPVPDGTVYGHVPLRPGLVEQEDQDVQNHMSLMVEIRPRWRRAVLKAFLWALNQLFYRALLPDALKGTLFGLRTIHCAQWVLLDGGRYVFLSNYDHSWETYLDDFGAHLAGGIQKIWGQSEGSPGTGDFEQFKRFVRGKMVPYSVWYRAYPGLTVRQIWNTESLRAALARDVTEEQMIDAVRRLGVAPPAIVEIVHAGQ